MGVLGWYGTPCSAGRCKTNGITQRATHEGMCARCWVSSSEEERRAALDRPRDPLAELFALPAVEIEGG